MFLYELSVDEKFRRKGIGTALVASLAKCAESVGCYGMWVLTDRDNEAAIGTYQKKGASEGSDQFMLSWEFV